LAAAVRDRDVFDIPGALAAMVRQCRNLGRPGLVSCAISAVETGMWDLKARLLTTSLSALLGAAQQWVPNYGSGGSPAHRLIGDR
jgi:L-alanine-DL-glutamate epimerase-like enolase superfamily enzyme